MDQLTLAVESVLLSLSRTTRLIAYRLQGRLSNIYSLPFRLFASYKNL